MKLNIFNTKLKEPVAWNSESDFANTAQEISQESRNSELDSIQEMINTTKEHIANEK